MSVSASLSPYVDAARAEVDAALARYLPGATVAPGRLVEAMHYSVFAGGKRLRPLLVLAAADAAVPHAPGARACALPAACALEMIHTYSLIHDDLPAMDDDTLRRGRPTLHVVYGDALAILAGDALLTEAFALLAREPADDEAGIRARKLRTLAVIAAAAGAAGMVGGQTLDLQGGVAPPSTRDAAVAALREIHARKTGALIGAAATAGAIMAGASDETIDAIARYAAELGLAFQIVDDVLDVEGVDADLGKTAGKDAATGKLTYPALHGVEASRHLAADCVARAKAELARCGIRGRLPDIADWVLERSS